MSDSAALALPNRGWGRTYAIAVCVGLLPLLWSCLTSLIVGVVFRRMAAGFVPGDQRLNDVWSSATDWARPGYFIVLPLVVLALILGLVLLRWPRDGRGPHLAAATLIAVALATISWVVGLLWLIARIWNT